MGIIMTRSTHSSDEESAAPSLTRGARARRALILRRAANRTSRRILRSLGGEARRLVTTPPPEFEVPMPEQTTREPLGRPVEPDVALEGERNRWGGRL
jgi:hypothetical protein